MTKKKGTKKEDKRCLVDCNGDLMPVKLIDQPVVKEHDLVEHLISEAKTLNTLLEEFKKKATKLISKHLDDIAQRYNEDWKGNAILYNYSKTEAIEFSISNTIDFDSRLEVAKTKIYHCIEKWSEGSNVHIIALVKKAFDSDKKGLVDTKRIISLTTLKIEDEDWKEAMQIIRESIITKSTKKYIQFKQREDSTEKLAVITLNFSAI